MADPTRRVVGVDFALEMLRQWADHVQMAAGDAQRLPFADAQFDAVVSGFLVRNLSDTELGLREQVRVLRPGGVLAVLETTPGPPGWLRPGYRVYFRHVVPVLGKLVAGDASAYTYLPESTLAFVEPARLIGMLQACGLDQVRSRALMFGTVALTVGYKPVGSEARRLEARRLEARRLSRRLEARRLEARRVEARYASTRRRGE